MTHLAARPVDEPDLLSLVADTWTPLAVPFADAFRDACKADADQHDGYVNPNRVRAALIDRPDYDPRRLSAMWCSASARSGFLVTLRDQRVPIEGEGSKGNLNKSVPLRKWREDQS